VGSASAQQQQEEGACKGEQWEHVEVLFELRQFKKSVPLAVRRKKKKKQEKTA
jgi:hypothetical protein